MTSFLFPKTRLAKLLRAAGGKPVAEALEDASANLKAIEPEAQAELQAMLREVEARYAVLGEAYDGEKLDELYFIANRAIGIAGVCGRGAVDSIWKDQRECGGGGGGADERASALAGAGVESSAPAGSGESFAFGGEDLSAICGIDPGAVSEDSAAECGIWAGFDVAAIG